jgi:peptidoglycan/xylan/chitin deacetylase (PgdA/CDA1 family)
MPGVKSEAKRALIGVCKRLERSSQRNRDAIVTLMHEVGGPASAYNITKPVFREQLKYLLGQEVSWYRATELAGSLTQIDSSAGVCVTFDDGTESAYTAAIELIDAGAKCTHFIIPGQVERKDGDRMSWSQIRELDAAGVEIGSHSVSHPHLTALDDKQLEEELVASKQALEDKLGKPVTAFAYPYGEYDRRVVESVIDSGYSCAFTTRHLYASRDSNVFQIPRFEPLQSVNHLVELFEGQGHWFYHFLDRYYKIRDLYR